MKGLTFVMVFLIFAVLIIGIFLVFALTMQRTSSMQPTMTSAYRQHVALNRENIEEIRKILRNEGVVWNMSVKIPTELEARYSAYKQHDVKAIASDMLLLKEKYGYIINEISKTLGIEKPLIYAFQVIEAPARLFGKKVCDNKGNCKRTLAETIISSAGAVGLMQVTPDGATDIVRIFHREKRLPKRVMEILRSINKTCVADGKCKFTNEDLFNGELNLWVGSMILKRNLEFYKDRLDMVIYSYNFRPTFSKEQAQKRMEIYPSVVDSLTKESPKLPLETKKYIVWLLGTYGTLNIASALEKEGKLWKA